MNLRTGAVLLLFLPTFAALSTADGSGVSIEEAPWTVGPVSDGHADLPDGVPFGQGRHMRVLLDVDVAPHMFGTRDIPVVYSLDVAAALRDVGYPSHATGQLRAFRLLMDSLVLVEVDPDGLHPVQQAGAGVHEPLFAFEGSFTDSRPFDDRTNPTVTLSWVMRGATHGVRSYMLYLDTEHNGPKQPVVVPAEDMGRAASVVGPGRGSRLYVPLHTNDIQAGQDPRSILVTNMQDAPVQVQVFMYDGSLPRDQPAWTMQLNTFGQQAEFRLSQQESASAALVKAQGGLVTAEATSRVTDASYVTGSSRLFVPSADGGFTGRLFAAGSQAAMNWYVFCPAIPGNEGGCRITFTGSPPQANIASGDYILLSAPGGQTAQLAAQQGAVAVERVPPSIAQSSQGQRTITSWPPLDGPAAASLFAGHAMSDQSRDKLMLMGMGSNTVVRAQSMEGARTRLTDALDIDGPGLFTDSAGGGWGTGWDRDWRVSTDPTTPRDQVDGATLVRTVAGSGLAVASGSTATGFSTLVPLQSRDGGLHYAFQVPRDATGNTIGKLVLFSLHDGTDVVATRSGSTGPCCQVYKSLQADQFVNDVGRGGAGWWTIEATRPVVVAWQNIHEGPFSAYAPGSTQAATVQVRTAQSAGYLIDATAQEPFRSVRPGSAVEFVLDVRNLARDVEGDAITDRVRLTAQAPVGWPTPEVVPSTITFAGTDVDAAKTARVSLRVPSGVDIEDGGATVVVQAQSSQEPRLAVETRLGINYKVERGVQVTANGKPSEAFASVGPGESVNYTVQVINTGSVRDRFVVQHEIAPNGWDLQVLCIEGDVAESCLDEGGGITPELLPQEAAEYLFIVTAESASSARFPLRFLAARENDPSISGSTRLVTTLDTERDLKFIVDEPLQVVDPGKDAVFQVTVRNDAESEEELRMVMSPQLPDGWERPAIEVLLAGSSSRTTLEALGGIVPVPQLEEVHLWVTQPVPTDAPPRLLGLDTLAVEGLLGSDLSRNIDLRVVVAELRGFEARPPDGPLSAAPGGTVDVHVTYASLGNGPQTLRVEPLIQGGTGWVFEDDNGNAPPWNVTLAAHAEASLDLRVRVPRDAPALPGGLPLILRSSVDGFPTVPVPVLLRVAEEAAVAVEPRPLVLDPGRTNEVAVQVTNVGNVPLQLRGAWSGLPWDTDVASGLLPVGSSFKLQFRIPVPPGAGAPGSVNLVLSDAQAALQDTSVWTVDVGRPRLEARMTDTRMIEGGARVVRVELINSGEDAAYDVVARLRQGDVTLDAVRIDIIQPGDTRVANLVAPPGSGKPVVSVHAAHDPEGFTLEPLLDVSAPDEDAPAPHGLAVFALLAVAFARRWRR